MVLVSCYISTLISAQRPLYMWHRILARSLLTKPSFLHSVRQYGGVCMLATVPNCDYQAPSKEKVLARLRHAILELHKQ